MLIREIRGRKTHQRKLKTFVKFVGENPSAQAETFVSIREIRGRKNYQRKLKNIRAIRGQTSISAS